MPLYKLLVSWQESGHMEVEADSPEEAVEIAKNDLPLPTEHDYISDSFEVDEVRSIDNQLIEVL